MNLLILLKMIDLFYFSFEDEELIYTKGNNDFKIIY